MIINTEELSLRPALRARRDSIVLAWSVALARTAVALPSAIELVARLGALLDQVIAALTAEPFAPEPARAIGADLAALAGNQLPTLGATIEILARELGGNHAPEQTAALQPILAVLLSELASGFAGQALAVTQPPAAAQPAPGGPGGQGAAELEAQYRLLVEHIPAITYVAALDTQSSTLYTSPQIEYMLGFVQAEWMADHTLWLKQVHPDDRALVLAALARSQAGEVAPCEYRMLTRDGRVVWFRDESALLRDADGRPLYLYGVMLDITARKQLEAELARVRRRLAQSQEDARRRIAADLHDGPVQQLLGVGYLLDEQQRRFVAGGLAAAQVADAARAITTAQREVREAVAQLRQAIGALRVDGLDELGLRVALEAYVARLTNERGVDRSVIELDLDEDRVRLPAEVAHCLFRAAQEALRNALRHAQARRVALRLRLGPSEALLEVRDDGRGFQVPAQLGMLVLDGHFGLAGLAEQVAWAGGRLDVRAQPGAGTSVTVRMNLGLAQE
ncbi:MAG: PAS domain-containing protein [Roseiflexaceae bacterium]